MISPKKDPFVNKLFENGLPEFLKGARLSVTSVTNAGKAKSWLPVSYSKSSPSHPIASTLSLGIRDDKAHPYFRWPPTFGLTYEGLLSVSSFWNSMADHHMNVFQYNHWKAPSGRNLSLKRSVKMADLKQTLQTSSKTYISMSRRSEHDGRTWLNDTEIDGMLAWLTFGTKPGHFHSVSTLITNAATRLATQTNYPSGARKTVTKDSAVYAEVVYPYAQKIVNMAQQHNKKTAKLPFLFYPVNQGGNHWILFVAVNVLEDNNSHNSGYFALDPLGDDTKDADNFAVRESKATAFPAEEAGFLLFVDAMQGYANRVSYRHPNIGVPYIHPSTKKPQIVARYFLGTLSASNMKRLAIPKGYVERQPNGNDCGVGVLLYCFQFIRRFPNRRLNQFDFHGEQLAGGSAVYSENYRYKVKETVLTDGEKDGGLPWVPYKRGELRMARFRHELFGWMDRLHILLHGKPTANIFNRRMVYRPLQELGKESLEPNLEKYSKVNRMELTLEDMNASGSKVSTTYKEWRPALPYVPVMYKTLSTSPPIPESRKTKVKVHKPAFSIRPRVTVQWVEENLNIACAMNGHFPDEAHSCLPDDVGYTAWNKVDSNQAVGKVLDVQDSYQDISGFADEADATAPLQDGPQHEMSGQDIDHEKGKINAGLTADNWRNKADDSNGEDNMSKAVDRTDDVKNNDSMDTDGNEDNVSGMGNTNIDADDIVGDKKRDGEDDETNDTKNNDNNTKDTVENKASDATPAVLPGPPTQRITRQAAKLMEAGKVVANVKPPPEPSAPPRQQDPAAVDDRLQQMRLARRATAVKRHQLSEAHQLRLEQWKVVTQLRRKNDFGQLQSDLADRLNRAKGLPAGNATKPKAKKQKLNRKRTKKDGSSKDKQNPPAEKDGSTKEGAKSSTDEDTTLPVYRGDRLSLTAAIAQPSIDQEQQRADAEYWSQPYTLSAEQLLDENGDVAREQMTSNGAQMEAAFLIFLKEQISKHNREMAALKSSGKKTRLNTTTVLMPAKIQAKWAKEEAVLAAEYADAAALVADANSNNKEIQRGQRLMEVCRHNRNEIAKEKTRYYSIIENFRQEWLTSQKGVVMGLKYVEKRKYIALCFWRRPVGASLARPKRSKSESCVRVPKKGNVDAHDIILSEIEVDDTWIDDNWEREDNESKMSHIVQMQTTSYSGFFPSKNQAHQGWIAMESTEATGICWNDERMVEVKTQSSLDKGDSEPSKKPAPPEFKLDPGWEVLMGNDTVVPKTAKEMVKLFGKGYMEFARTRRSMKVRKGTAQQHVGFIPMRLGAVEVRPDITNKILKGTEVLMEKQGLLERPQVQFPQGQFDICVHAAT